MLRVICYVDGFNLYHAINDLEKPHLKWVNLSSLAASICRKNEEIQRVSYFSAYASWLPHKVQRHQLYVSALQHYGVICSMARFTEKTVSCRNCNSRWRSREEKETDVNFALTFLEDAFLDEFDRAIIISADGDYVPAVKSVRRRFPKKEVFLAAPPGRLGHARELSAVCSGSLQITAGRIARHLLPERITLSTGDTITRPSHYDWPVGWTPPPPQ